MSDGSLEVKKKQLLGWLKRLLAVVCLVAALVVGLHSAVVVSTSMNPPAIKPMQGEVSVAPDDPQRREIAGSYVRKRGRIREVRLLGSGRENGFYHGKLLYQDQLKIERVLQSQFAEFVPYRLARSLMVDLARMRFRGIDRQLLPERRLEIAAQAEVFQPDPLVSFMATYDRFVYLHSLYDIMLSFEHSPLLGCSSMVVGPELTGGDTLVARNFDFEGPQVLDTEKAVFLMLGDGPVAYATVSWPGFVGAATGMNSEGLAVVIHGARAGETDPSGKPVAHTVRRLLANCKSTEEALALLAEVPPMVPHMLLLSDRHAKSVVVERVPRFPMHIRQQVGPVLPLSNHLEGPLAQDPKNQRVLGETSSKARRQRLDALAKRLPKPFGVADAIALLRDKRGADGSTLALGHRSAIDGLLATHSVVMNTTRRELWVSEGPHAAGRFVLFRLAELLKSGTPKGPTTVESLPADSILKDGRYASWKSAGAKHPQDAP